MLLAGHLTIPQTENIRTKSNRGSRPFGTAEYSDWAIIRYDGQAIYLVRETKSIRDFLKLRTIEADKVRCGAKHFETLGVDFKIAVTADKV